MMDTASTQQTMDVFIVQKCWYAGPHVSKAVDYRRLFTSRHAAEQTAYHSAHLSSPTVRTLTLPDGYGFVSNGQQLFWVRRATAVATTTNDGNSNNHTSYGEAHCIATQGILGAGSQSSGARRAVVRTSNDTTASTTTPTIFVGPHSAHVAQHHCPISSSSFLVQWVPLSRMAVVDASQLSHEWPDYSIWKTTSNNNMDDDSSSSKRSEPYDLLLWGGQSATTMIPPAKRRCRTASTAFLLNECNSGNTNNWNTTTKNASEMRMEL